MSKADVAKWIRWADEANSSDIGAYNAQELTELNELLRQIAEEISTIPSSKEIAQRYPQLGLLVAALIRNTALMATPLATPVVKCFVSLISIDKSPSSKLEQKATQFAFTHLHAATKINTAKLGSTQAPLNMIAALGFDHLDIANSTREEFIKLASTHPHMIRWNVLQQRLAPLSAFPRDQWLDPLKSMVTLLEQYTNASANIPHLRQTVTVSPNNEEGTKPDDAFISSILEVVRTTALVRPLIANSELAQMISPNLALLLRRPYLFLEANRMLGNLLIETECPLPTMRIITTIHRCLREAIANIQTRNTLDDIAISLQAYHPPVLARLVAFLSLGPARERFIELREIRNSIVQYGNAAMRAVWFTYLQFWEWTEFAISMAADRTASSTAWHLEHIAWVMQPYEANETTCDVYHKWLTRVTSTIRTAIRDNRSPLDQLRGDLDGNTDRARKPPVGARAVVAWVILGTIGWAPSPTVVIQAACELLLDVRTSTTLNVCYLEWVIAAVERWVQWNANSSKMQELVECLAGEIEKIRPLIASRKELLADLSNRIRSALQPLSPAPQGMQTLLALLD